jgi:hypothetical protein
MFKKGNILYFILSFIFVITLSNSSFQLYKTYSDSKVQIDNMSYTNKSKISYFVTIKDNSFISSRVLPSGKTYITELVDNIRMTMEYEYDADLKLPFEQDHKIIATIYGLYNENPNSTRNPVIWEKEYSIKNLTKETVQDGDKVLITETFDIDLAIYNDEANRFKAVFSIPTIAYLEITMPVNIVGGNDDFELKENYTVLAKIPLTEKVFYIEASSNDESEKLVPSKNVEEINIDQRQLTIHLVIAISSIVLLLISVKKIIDSNNKEEYYSYLDKIKKDFNEIIVETDNMVNAKDLQPIVITSFEEMLNLATSLELPIILYEEANLAVFYIVKNELLYSYLVKRDRKKEDN